MLTKKEIFTFCTPIPSFIPRQLALSVLHNHSEVITLNPLVLSHKPVKPPSNAAKDEYYCTWYEITERIQYVPGLGKMGSGEISFNGCFHDMPWGLQTHIYAPMSVDMRAQYRVAGEPVGFPSQGPRELGLEAIGAPAEGLYLRADIEFTSNVLLASFVKTQSKAAIKEMVERMVKKAEMLDADVLKGMIESEKLSLVEKPGAAKKEFVAELPGCEVPVHRGSYGQSSPYSQQNGFAQGSPQVYSSPRMQSAGYSQPSLYSQSSGRTDRW